MRSLVRITIASGIVLLFLTGCWDKTELVDLAFIQGVAIDLADDGQIQLTSHLYRPSGGSGASSQQGQRANKFVNIITKDHSVFEAVRDLTIHLGRRGQWSHMRVLVISEELAQKKSIAEVLDFFARDHEVRGTIAVLISKGKASEYFQVKPLIENTTGQQFREIQEKTSRYTGKTGKISFLDLSIQLKNQSGAGVVPYVYIVNTEVGKTVSIAGLAIIKDGIMTGLISPDDTEEVSILTNKFQNGIIRIPCTNEGNEEEPEMDAYEVLSAKTKLTPKIKKDSITVKVQTKLEGSAGELVCSSLTTTEETKRLLQKIEKDVVKEMKASIRLLQKQKADVLGIADQIYRKNPALWKKWKPDWEDRFADIRFEIDVEAKINNTGMNVGKPYGK
jgi:spore germination protein KC